MPANLFKKRSFALTLIKLISNCSLNIFSTSSPSFLRSKPWSTNIQVKFFPIALLSKTAATEESTPPDKAHKAFPSPIFSFYYFMLSSTKEEICQSPEHLQILNKKFLITCVPLIDKFTSGWN